MTIQTLIDKQDNFEIIRDQIAAILVLEVASQMALATLAAKDPNDFKLRIFTERSNPWEQFLNDQVDRSPLVNVWYDNSNFNLSKSNILERQASETIYNIDCYGFGISKDDGAGHKPGDREAALEVQKALRLVRNILMAAEYTYLGLRGLVWQRWPQSITVFQPELGSQQMQQIVGARLAFRVIFNEFSPQFELETLELLSVDVIRVEDGEIVLKADYQYPLVPVVLQRILITLNGVDEYFTFQNTKIFPDDFDLSIDAVLPTAATTVTLFGQTASADHYIKVLSTGFVSINIDTSIVTSTVLATKDNKQRRYGVRVVGDDFIFTEEGIAIDTVTDAVAAAKTLIINVIAQSNGADFFNNTLSDPILTDLTTASNSVSWQLNRALPATTEQSTDSTNLLTYVGAPKTELFTFNQSDGGWDGSVERIENGRFDTGASWSTGVGWTISGGLARADLSSGFINLSQSSVQTPGEIFKTMFKLINYGVGDLAINLGGGVNGTQRSSNGTFTEILPPAVSNFFKFFNVAATTELDVDEVSVKRFIPVA